MISSTQFLGFLMHPKGGHKRPRRGHSLICSLLEFEREKEDEVLGIGRGNIGCLLAWRESTGLVPNLFSGELPVLRRAHLRRRAHHQWGELRVVRLQ
jgi:hypothetical protein